MTRSRFIVVLHEAKRAGKHHDLRFVMPNSKIWISFAIRKEIPLTPGNKVLAVRTHDHTEEEALFTGEITDGYGKGKLTKWDDGKCEIIKFASKHMIVKFGGRKLKGVYHLVNLGVVNRKYREQHFLFFKGKEMRENTSFVEQYLWELLGSSRNKINNSI